MKLLLSIFAVLFSGCVTTAELSVTPTPRSWNGDGFVESFSTAREHFKTISLQDPIDWWYLEGKKPSESKAYKDYQWQKTLLGGLDVFIQIDPYPARYGDLLPGRTFADESVQKAYLQDAMQRLQLYKPKFMCLAMEINSYYMTHPEDFDNFMKCYRMITMELRSVSPETYLFVSFQYETLKKYNQWHLFSNEFDAIGITTYPLTFDPSISAELNSDYFTQIKQHTPRPIIFTEIGWTTDPRYNGSQESQRKFLMTLTNQTKKMEVFLYNYQFLYDAKGFGEPFDMMGLMDAEGKPKLAFTTYQKLMNK